MLAMMSVATCHNSGSTVVGRTKVQLSEKQKQNNCGRELEFLCVHILKEDTWFLLASLEQTHTHTHTKAGEFS